MIDTSSVYAIEQELAKISDERREVGNIRAKAIKEVDTLQMEIAIYHAETVKRLCEEQKIKAVSGKAEIRRVDALLDPFYKKLRIRLIDATEHMNIVNSDYFILGDRVNILLELYKNAKRQMYETTVYEDDVRRHTGKRLSTKMRDTGEMLEYED